MNLKKIAKIFSIFLILITLFNVINTINVVAWGGKYTDVDQFDHYITTDSKVNKVDKLITRALGIALKVLRTVTFGWAIISLIYIAIYMMTEASPWEKMKLKENHIPTFIIGVICLFGSTGILQFIYYFVNQTLKKE